MHENNRIEYKQKITPELEKEVVAFLNSNEGGVIYIGIDKTGKIVGVENPDEEQLLLKDRFKQSGSSVPRILQTYPKEYFKFSENFSQITLPAEEDTEQVTPQVEKLLQFFEGNHFREELP